jgi:plastocyanin
LKRAFTILAVAAAFSLPLKAQQARPAGAAVSIDGFNFTPAKLTVHQGDPIIFTNNDVVRHDVTGDGWGAGTILVGASGVATINKAGTFDYICTRHPGMAGTIVVE